MTEAHMEKMGTALMSDEEISDTQDTTTRRPWWYMTTRLPIIQNKYSDLHSSTTILIQWVPIGPIIPVPVTEATPPTMSYETENN